MSRLIRMVLIMVLFTVCATIQGQEKNGFSVANALIPRDEIHPGGPPRDGIPAIDRPRFVNADAAGFLRASDRVLGITHNGMSKAYPVAILNWHEIVNDRIAGEPIVVTFCPLCGTGIAYLATTGDQVLDFGVSGLLYNSDMLLYDRQTQSLWSQIRRQAVSGPMQGTKLQPVPVMHTQWADWKQRYPATRVLSTETGYRRDYTKSPYQGYEKTADLFFPVRARDDRYHPKESVLGVEITGRFKAYPFVELEKSGGDVHDTFAGQTMVVKYDKQYRTAVAADGQGHTLPGVIAFWFAWYAFHPDTEVYRAD
ncbi:MAG: DUF3179 domain-containing protein [Gammaproteobacteria bacterium]|nr:DUF3179 domain-containing protein [Gammaproteobacteria bacterium]